MSVFQRRDRARQWVFDFWLGGVRYRGRCLDLDGRPVGSKTDAIAAEKREHATAQAGRSTARSVVRAGEYTFGQAGALHLKRIVDRKRKPEHLDNHRLYVAEILKFFGPALAFRELTQERCDDYSAWCQLQTVRIWTGGNTKRTDQDLTDPKKWRDTGKPRSPRQVNNYLKCLRRLVAIAAKVRDPVTRQPALESAIEIELLKVPRRRPRPMPDAELAARRRHVPPWTQEALDLKRLYGLRLTEALSVGLRHVDRDRKGLTFRGGDTKSGNDETAFGGKEGWELLKRLERQARKRGVQHLVTWPGPKHWRAVLEGRRLPKGETVEWRPMTTLGTSWRRSAERAGIEHRHRAHDVRARYITEVAKVSKAAAKDAARHQDPATTDLYIGVADTEVSDAVARAVARRPKAGRGKLWLVR